MDETKVQSIALGSIPDRFEQVCLTSDCMIEYMTSLIGLWIHTDDPYNMTCNFIHNEMDMDDESGMFLVYTIDELMRVAGVVRTVSLTGRLLSFKVTAQVILLTIAVAQG